MFRIDVMREGWRESFAPLAFVVLLALLGSAGLATDYARLKRETRHFAQVLDETSTMLAGLPAAQPPEALVDIARRFFDHRAAARGLRPATPLVVSWEEGCMTLSASGTVLTSVGPLFGLNEWGFEVEAEPTCTPSGAQAEAHALRGMTP